MENNQTTEQGKNFAIASLVLGIIAIVLWFFGYSAIASVLCGIIGIVCASNAKKQGFTGGMQTAGFVLSLLGLIVGGIVFVSCLACYGTAAGIANSFANQYR